MRGWGDSLSIGLALAVAGCDTQELPARSRFVEDGVTLEAPVPWSGEAISVDSAGVTPTGGLSLSVGDVARVRSTARMLALADTSDKPSADAAIDEVKRTAYTLTTAGGVTSVRCGHVAQFGSVAPGDAGCDAIEVALPRGTDTTPLSVTARSAKGLVVASLDGATLKSLELYGQGGRIELTTPATPNATILVASESGDEVTLRLPAKFETDSLVLEAPPGAIDTRAFPDLQLGGGRGEVGRGAKSITVRAGRIVLASIP